MPDGKLWTQRDRFGNDIYLTHERWADIVDPDNHPEVAPFFEYLPETIRLGRRRQDAYDPNSYQYSRAFPDLPDDNCADPIKLDTLGADFSEHREAVHAYAAIAPRIQPA